MFDLKKAAVVGKSIVADEETMAAVNRLSRRVLQPAEVYLFAIRACDDLPDRDGERFTEQCLKDLAPMYVGRTVICGHEWNMTNQVARVFAAEVCKDGNANFLRLSCYMPRLGQAEQLIEAIDTGIVKEVSVGCSVTKRTCSICGQPYFDCDHHRGSEYEGEICVVELSEPVDAYEVSFVAVPAQPKAGVCKGKSDPEKKKREDKPNGFENENELEAAKGRLRLEQIRF